MRTRARTCEDSIPPSGPQCEPYISKVETEEQPGICVRTGRMEGMKKNTKAFSTGATTHHKLALDCGSIFGTGASNMKCFCLPLVVIFLCVQNTG